MENLVASTCKTVAKIYGLIGILAWMLIGVGDSVFGFLLYTGGIFVSALFLYAVGEIIQLLQNIASSTSYYQNTSVAGGSGDGRPSNSNVGSKKKVTFFGEGKQYWTCNKCHAANRATDIYCKECGEYR